MTDEQEFSVIYDGALAATGQLNFYEFSRASYGFARLIATIDNFRRTGVVPKRITKQTNVELIIRAPEKGSFPIEIIAPLVQISKDVSVATAGIPLNVFVKYAFQLVKRILPQSEDRAKAIIEIELKREIERTSQSREETKRLKEIREIVADGHYTSRLALQIIREKTTSSDMAIGRLGETSESLHSLLNELLEHQSREKEIEPYKNQLESIQPKKIAELTRKIRPQIAELGVPLGRSADIISIKSGRKSKTMIASFDKNTISDITLRDIDENTTNLKIRIIQYNRDGGFGRCDIDNVNQIILKNFSFSIPHAIRNYLNYDVANALTAEFIDAQVRFYRDKSGNPTSILIESLESEDY